VEGDLCVVDASKSGSVIREKRMVIVKIENCVEFDAVKAACKARYVQRMNYLRITTLLDSKTALVKIKGEAFLSSSAHPCRPATHHLPGY
jgi:hypothetical protein